MKYVVTSEQMQNAENDAFEKGLSPFSAMEKAGTFVFYEAEKFNKVLIVANHGNNGGDGFVCAQKLIEKGKDADVLFIGDEKKLSDHARKFYENIKDNIIENPDDDYDCIVDAIFGIGFRGQLQGKALEAVNLINSFKNKAKIISVDIPSGLNGLTGEAEASVDADITVTFQAEKLGLIINKGADFSGEIKVCDIGIDVFSKIKRVDKVDFPEIKRTAHKGTQGHIGIIAGSFGMEGAAMLASAAAIKSGAGKVSLAVSEDIKNNFVRRAPEVMLTLRSDEFISDKDVVLFGCGIGRKEDNKKILEFLIENCTCPLVIDADGLYFLTKEHLKKAKCPVILTPHMGEASRLFNVDVGDLIKNPVEIAMDFAKETGATVLLKSNYNLVVNKDEAYISTFGCPGMATAGSGDVLAGIVASMVHIMPTKIEAAINASYLHGRAGNLAQKEKTPYGVTASDILNNIFKEIEL